MENKLLNLLENQSKKILELNAIQALKELSDAYLYVKDFPNAIKLIEKNLKLEEDHEYMRDSHYFKVAEHVIRAGDMDTFNKIAEYIDSDYREIFQSILDLKYKKYPEAFAGLAQLDEDDYEFESSVVSLITDVLPKSIRLFPIDTLMKRLPSNSLKNQVFNNFADLIFEKLNPSNKKESIKLFKKYAAKDEKKSYINDFSALAFAKDNNYKKAIKFAAKACDLRELGLLKDISDIFKQNNEIDTAIDVATLAVEKSKQIDWEYYSQSMESMASVYAQSQSASYLIEYLIILCRLHHKKGNSNKVENILEQIKLSINNMPEESHYVEWKIIQFFNLIEFGVETNNTELVKDGIEKYHPLVLKNIESLSSNIDTTILDALSKHIESLNNKSINQFIKLISKPITDKSNDFHTLVSWVELLVALNKTQQAKKLSGYLLKKVKNNDDIWSIYDVAPIHFKIHSYDEIEVLFDQIGPNKSACYLQAVAKETS